MSQNILLSVLLLKINQAANSCQFAFALIYFVLKLGDFVKIYINLYLHYKTKINALEFLVTYRGKHKIKIQNSIIMEFMEKYPDLAKISLWQELAEKLNCSVLNCGVFFLIDMD